MGDHSNSSISVFLLFGGPFIRLSNKKGVFLKVHLCRLLLRVVLLLVLFRSIIIWLFIMIRLEILEGVGKGLELQGVFD